MEQTSTRSPETITLLIDHGVDIFATTRDEPPLRLGQQTALEIAASFGRGANARAIVDHPTFDRADRASRQRLLDKSLCVGAISLQTGGNEEWQTLINTLLQKGAHPNAADGRGTAVQLVVREIRPNADQENAAVKQIGALLRQHGATVDLFSAVAIGDLLEVRRLVREKPEAARARGADGYPALHFAVSMNAKDIVGALLDAGCDVDMRNQSNDTGAVGETALHCAAFWGRYEIAKLLIDRGADVNARTERQGTPLHDAARVGNVKIVRLLLEKGAKPDARDKDNKTPLESCRDGRSNHTAAIQKAFAEHRARDGR
jgi:ankyrin repeat protein